MYVYAQTSLSQKGYFTVKVNNFAKEALAGTSGDFIAEIFCSAPYVIVFISEFRGCKYGRSMAAMVYVCV